MSHVPLPVRVAMGLVVTAVEQARKLPDQLADLPVTAASKAVQAGMRVQQRVTALAIKGDEVFSLLHPIEDTPPWARFDEDDEPDAPPPPDTHTTTSPTSDRGQANHRAGSVVGPGAGHGAAVGESGEIDEADVAAALTPLSADTGTEPSHASPTPKDAGPTPKDAGPTPSALPGYDQMSVAQLRAKLRVLSLPQLTELLEYEHGHQDRPAFVTLLSNRISTVRSRTTESP